MLNVFTYERYFRMLALFCVVAFIWCFFTREHSITAVYNLHETCDFKTSKTGDDRNGKI